MGHFLLMLRRNGWQIAAGAMLIGTLGASRGGIGALLPLLRFALPALAIYLIYRAVKKRVSGVLGNTMRRSFEQAQQQARGGNQVIDLCPKCGAYQQPGHRCASR